MSTQTSTEAFSHDPPPWRSSHTAASPDGAVVATIAEAVELAAKEITE